MVETSPSDEERSYTLDSDDDAEQSRTVSPQDEEQNSVKQEVVQPSNHQPPLHSSQFHKRRRGNVSQASYRGKAREGNPIANNLAGLGTFTREILRDRSRGIKPTLPPFVLCLQWFLPMGNRCSSRLHVHLDKSHHCDGILGCFIGNRTIMAFQGDRFIQDPTFVMLCERTFIDHGFKIKPALDGAIRKMDPTERRIIKGNQKPTCLAAVCLPLPLAWAP
jgi:hypothetical protein